MTDHTFQPSRPDRLRLACDVHTHTLASRHAYSTIAENVHAAAAAGLELLGSADHFGSMINPAGDLRSVQHLINCEIWPRSWENVTLLRACEADIMDTEGHLYGWDIPIDQGITGKRLDAPTTLKDYVFGRLDYVVASIHNDDLMQGASLAATTQMYVNALEDPKVLILGHAGRAGVPFDLDEVLTVAKEKGKLIEINEHSLEGRRAAASHERCRKLAERCAEMGVMVATSTDAHLCCAIGRFPRVRGLLDEVDFPQDLVATREARTFLEVARRAVGLSL